MLATSLGRGSVFALATAAALLSAPSSLFAGTFTAEQATAGDPAYQANCAQCHGAKLEGPEAPGLFGQDVMGNWDTAGGLYDFISVAMPPAAPGQLGEDVYLQIVAYIMQENGATPSDKALTIENMADVSLVAETKDGAAALEAARNAGAPAAAEAAVKVPQAYTWGKELPQFKK